MIPIPDFLGGNMAHMFYPPRHVRYDDYIRAVHHRHPPPVNLGASRATIERYTHAHKYPKREKFDEEEENIEKCTICLCEFEVLEDVR